MLVTLDFGWFVYLVFSCRFRRLFVLIVEYLMFSGYFVCFLFLILCLVCVLVFGFPALTVMI